MGLSMLYRIFRCIEKKAKISYSQIEEVGNEPPLIVELLNNMEKLKPTRFTSHHLNVATSNFTHKLGAGGFGEVYKGSLPNGNSVAVKVLKGSSDEQIEAQFIAELSKIAIGMAKGIAYLHEDCQDRMIHYDIKPGYILLDQNFSPKVADFGLAKLCNRDATHVTMTIGRGTPGYAAPELGMPCPVTHKEEEELEVSLPESQEWFLRWVWNNLERGEMEEIVKSCEIEEEDSEILERMIMVAVWCVQYKPELRPCMSSVVKMLEGGIENILPPNPFAHLVARPSVMDW
ncbi:hypothetical protein AMTR_s00019p00230350 [Amborella trichopoda]|uniref:Protein kinase domain-containing protein n=1 Tax=Amborella trichopoda TaxID=13333 RepID=W1PI03_AMBTC|nr:hypothetical protein AMTR_s00019p00230350 [Amborella trichopoda]